MQLLGRKHIHLADESVDLLRRALVTPVSPAIRGNCVGEVRLGKEDPGIGTFGSPQISLASPINFAFVENISTLLLCTFSVLRCY